MLMKQSLLRVAAASAAAVFVTLGAVGPTYADDHGDQRDRGHAAAAQSKKSDDTRADKDAKTGSDDAGDQQRSPEQSKRADRAQRDKSVAPEQGKANPPRHMPVTVCHLLGNGSYHLLTFDDSALKAHQAHGDLYPAPAAGCPTAEATVPPLALPDSQVAASLSGRAPAAEVLGVETFLTTHKTTARHGSPAVLGVEATRTANRAPVQLAPVAGILPQTGAGRFGLLVATGLGLLGAGGVMLSRKRAQAGS
jgi:LPXTG-motif cell wall-anchored protein